MLKKLAVLAAALAVSAPAFADRGHGNGRGHAYGHGHGYGDPHRVVVVHKPHYVVHRPAPVVQHYYYRPAPRPVYVVEQHNHVNPVAFLAGAVIGAAIVHHAVTGY